MTGQKQGGERRGAGLTQWLGQFVRETRGNVAMMFGMALPLLLMVGLGAIDIHQASRVKANLQDALDAAALAAARSPYADANMIQTVGMDALKANMPDYFAAGSQDTATFVLEDNVLVADARVNVKVLVANIVLPPYGKLLDDFLPVSGRAEVLRASRNVEVGMALDVTVSMKGQPLEDLKDAAKELIEIVVQDQQVPFYSKMGIVPYASGVNLGPQKVIDARGSVRGPTNIKSGAFLESASKAITGITKNAEAVVTATGHGFVNDQAVVISNVRGMTAVNDVPYRVVYVDANRFKLKSIASGKLVNSTGYSTYSSGGVARKCLQDDCSLVLSSDNHRLNQGETIRVTRMSRLTQYNDKYHSVRVIDQERFSLVGSTYSSTLPDNDKGVVQCVSDDCKEFYFKSARNTDLRPTISDCVTERTGEHAYRDTAPSTAFYGRHYPTGMATCPTSVVTPLTSTRATLTQAIDDLEDEGTTGGHIGIAWAWNMVSPRFANFWGGTSAPGVRDDDETLKVVILMTDGEFNTPYCRGVVSTDATVASIVGRDNVIGNCNATNGNPFAQAVQLCTAMKNDGIIVYTVGFNLGSGRGASGVDTAVEVMETCATTIANHFHNADSGEDLRDAFRAIGRDITRLRLAR